MQAVILVGGEGTRLRPLTSSVPKPVVPLVDRPMMVYMLEWLRRHGIDDVIMSCGFKATNVRTALGDGSQLRISLSFVEEPNVLARGVRVFPGMEVPDGGLAF
jgi:mannose-1-phosphate guanylyltransferase